MAGRIAGITIEIGGETTKLQTALKGVNGSLRDTNSALKDVNKLLKLDPGNTELLAQKQKLLGDAIRDTAEKLKIEKEALEQLKNAPQTEENIRQQEALTREIADTEQQLKGLENEYKDFGSVAKQEAQAAAVEIKKIGENISAAGDKISGFGKALTVGVTGPVTAAAAASAKAWSEVDDAADTVIKKTGATGEAADALIQSMNKVATTIPTSFGTAADAVGEVNTRFGLTGEALETLSIQFIRFAELNETDVSTSVDLVQSALAAFNLTVDNAGPLLDTLNKASQDTGTSVDILAGLLASNAATLKEMGYSASDSAMLLANLSKEGVDVSAVVTGLKKAYVESTAQGVEMSAMLGELENRLRSSTDNSGAAADAIELFGAKAGPALVSAIEDGRLSFDAFGTSLTDFTGNVENTFNATLDPVDGLTTTMNELKLVGADLVETAGPMLVDIFGQVAEVVGGLTEAWNSLDEGQQQTIIKCALVAAAAGPVISTVGGITSGIGSLVSAGSGLIGTAGGLIEKFTGMASGAGSAVEKVSALGSAASGASAPISSAGGSVGTLSQNALGLVAAGAGILLAAGGLYMLAQAAIQIADAGPGAGVAMVGLVAGLAGLAAGAAVAAPALAAGAAGLVAFGAAVALVGGGIFLATSGVVQLAGQLPNIASYGVPAAAALVQIGGGLTALSAGSLAAAAGMVAMLAPFAGATLTIAAFDLALVGLGATFGVAALGAVALGASMELVSSPVQSIREDAEAAGGALSDMVASVNIVNAAMGGLQGVLGSAADAFAALFSDAMPKASGSAKAMTDASMRAILQSEQTGMRAVLAAWTANLESMNMATRAGMLATESTVQSSINRLRQMFAGTTFSFNQRIPLPHFSMSGSFDAQSGRVPSVSVNWYRKAYDDAYLLNGATIFGAMNGRYLGGGEAGSEMVVGTEKLMGMITDAIRDAGGRNGEGSLPGRTTNNLGGITINVYGAPGQDVHELADIVMDEIQTGVMQKEGAF